MSRENFKNKSIAEQQCNKGKVDVQAAIGANGLTCLAFMSYIP